MVVPAAARRAVLLFQSAVPEAVLTPEALRADRQYRRVADRKHTGQRHHFAYAASGEADFLAFPAPDDGGLHGDR